MSDHSDLRPPPLHLAWRRLRAVLVAHRPAVHAAIDAAAWILALLGGMAVRFDLHLDSDRWGKFSTGDLLLVMGIAAVLQIAIGWAIGLYQARWRFGSFDEVAALGQVVVAVTAIVALLNRVAPGDQHVPNSVVLIAGVLALVFMATARYLWRLQLERSLRPSAHATRVLVLGAGEGGIQLITAMLRNPDSQYLPVALLDDDPAKTNLRIMGVPVVGTRDDLTRCAAELDIELVIIAVPSADAELVRSVVDVAGAAGLDVRVVPPVHSLLDGTIGVADVRPVTEGDLLGRHAIDTDVAAIAGYLTGKRVLVTGAGGSIGAELCHQVARFAPESLVMLDRDESALHAVQLSLTGRAMLDDRCLVVADLRDAPRLRDVFAEHRPQVVFHAAALKHLPLLEMHPGEAVKTNVWGTWHTLIAARDAGVERFVNISTDKAAEPCSILGYSKRISERLTATIAPDASGTFLSVRFGNVLGSRGSVLTAFESQVRRGGPITVTDPDVTRYFMTIEEAVQLVIQAGAVGRDGEVLVLDMGSPVRIAEVAHRLAANAERPIEIVYTGLRPGEKLHEVLLGADEVDARPFHPLISQVPTPPLDLAELHRLDDALDDAALRSLLAAITASAASAPRPSGAADTVG